MSPISNPHIRDVITIDDAFSDRLSTFAGPGPIYLLARLVDQRTDLRVGALSVVIVADELNGNGHLINAEGAGSGLPGGRGADAGPTPVGQVGRPGADGGGGGAGSSGGSVTVVCRRSSGVAIRTSGGSGAPGGPGGNGGPGSRGTSIPGGTTTETQIDGNGDVVEVEVQLPDIEIPGTLGGGGGAGGDGGAGGNAGSISFTSIVDDTAPVLEASGGAGGAGGAGGLFGPAGAFAEIPEDLDTTPFPGAAGAPGVDGPISVTTVSEDDYISGLRPLLDVPGPFANDWAPYRWRVGEYFYRQYRRSDPSKAQLAATEFARTLELQPDNTEALRLRSQLLDVPRPVSGGALVEWQPGGLNVLGLPLNMDVLPRFEAYRDAFTSFGALVLDFLELGAEVLLQEQDLDVWQSNLRNQHRQAVDAQQTTIEDRAQAETEARIAAEDIAGIQAQLDQTTRDIKTALEAMRAKPLSIGGILGTVASVAAAVVAVVAAVPSFGTSLVALVPAMVALSSEVIDNTEPIAQAVLSGDPVNTASIKKAYDKVSTQAGSLVKGAKAIVSFVEVVQKLNAAATPDNSKHLALVRHGVELTHELLLARHRDTLAHQRQDAAQARIGRAADAVTGIEAIQADLSATEEALKLTGLHAIAIAESKADALLTLAFYAQRSVEIYTLTDQEEKVQLESGHLHPDIRQQYVDGEIEESELVRRLNDSWSGLLNLLDLQVDFDRFTTQFHEPDRLRLSFRTGGPELDILRATRRFAFRVDAASLPPEQVDCKVQGVRLALVGATHPAGAVTCEIRHGSTYESRRSDGSITSIILQPRGSFREAKLDRLIADEGLGPDPVLTDPQSIAFWGRGIGGDWELAIPEHEFAAGLNLDGLTEVQVWIVYQFLR